MSRAISLSGLQSLMAQETNHSWHCALTISGPSMATVRAIQNTVDVVYGAATYLACPFELTLAQDTEDSVPQATVRVDNVSRDLVTAIRTAAYSPDVDLEVFRIDTAGTVTREVGPMRFSLLTTKVDALVIEGTLGYLTDFLNESATKDRFVPSIARALFA